MENIVSVISRFMSKADASLLDSARVHLSKNKLNEAIKTIEHILNECC